MSDPHSSDRIFPAAALTRAVATVIAALRIAGSELPAWIATAPTGRAIRM